MFRVFVEQKHLLRPNGFKLLKAWLVDLHNIYIDNRLQDSVCGIFRVSMFYAIQSHSLG